MNEHQREPTPLTLSQRVEDEKVSIKSCFCTIAFSSLLLAFSSLLLLRGFPNYPDKFVGWTNPAAGPYQRLP